MTMGSFGAFGPETLSEMGEIRTPPLKNSKPGRADVVRERIAMRIVAAAKLGERDPARLLAAALRRAD
jgi:hypothetical protein